jgi:quinol monooxygenase YgiN
MSKNAYIVIAILKAKIGKELELKAALQKVVGSCRAETTCLEYRLHQDLNDRAKFIFYEVWTSKEAHQKQFKKPYILDLAENTKDLLEGSYEVFFAEEI